MVSQARFHVRKGVAPLKLVEGHLLAPFFTGFHVRKGVAPLKLADQIIIYHKHIFGFHVGKGVAPLKPHAAPRRDATRRLVSTSEKAWPH